MKNVGEVQISIRIYRHAVGIVELDGSGGTSVANGSKQGIPIILPNEADEGRKDSI
jgi:hypothetical protein